MENYFELPIEVLIVLFENTHPKEIGYFGRVCKLWTKVARDNEMWRQYCFKRYKGLPEKSTNWRIVCKIKYLASELHSVWPDWDDTWQKTTEVADYYINQDLKKWNDLQICQAVLLILEIDEYVGQHIRYDRLHLCIGISIIRMKEVKKSARSSPRAYLFPLRKIVGYYYGKRVSYMALGEKRIDSSHLTLTQNFFTLVPHGDEYVQRELKKLSLQHLETTLRICKHLNMLQIRNWIKNERSSFGTEQYFVDVAIAFYFEFNKKTVIRELPKLVHEPILMLGALNYVTSSRTDKRENLKNILNTNIEVLISHFTSLPSNTTVSDWPLYLSYYAEVFTLVSDPLKHIKIETVVEVLTSAVGKSIDINAAICYFLTKFYSNPELDASTTRLGYDIVIDFVRKLIIPGDAEINQGPLRVVKQLSMKAPNEYDNQFSETLQVFTEIDTEPRIRVEISKHLIRTNNNDEKSMQYFENLHARVMADYNAGLITSHDFIHATQSSIQVIKSKLLQLLPFIIETAFKAFESEIENRELQRLTKKRICTILEFAALNFAREDLLPLYDDLNRCALQILTSSKNDFMDLTLLYCKIFDTTEHLNIEQVQPVLIALIHHADVNVVVSKIYIISKLFWQLLKICPENDKQLLFSEQVMIAYCNIILPKAYSSMLKLNIELLALCPSHYQLNLDPIAKIFELVTTSDDISDDKIMLCWRLLGFLRSDVQFATEGITRLLDKSFSEYFLNPKNGPIIAAKEDDFVESIQNLVKSCYRDWNKSVISTLITYLRAQNLAPKLIRVLESIE